MAVELSWPEVMALARTEARRRRRSRCRPERFLPGFSRAAADSACDAGLHR
jgi:hypothetical protein